jgi:hypothetical protein
VPGACGETAIGHRKNTEDGEDDESGNTEHACKILPQDGRCGKCNYGCLMTKPQ